jgi:hypothetical protein
MEIEIQRRLKFFYIYSLVYFPELAPVILPLLSFFGSFFEKLGADVGNPFFWLRRNLFDIVIERLKKNVISKNLSY